MKTTKKWLIFWGILGALVLGFFIVVLTGNFPQFEIPFSAFASDDKQTKKADLPKLTSIALKDYNDQELLEQQLEKINALNTKLKDTATYASSDVLSATLGEVYGTVLQPKGVFRVYRLFYPVISSEEASFVKVSLLGYGVRLEDDQPVKTIRQLWTFTDADGKRNDYQVALTYDDKNLRSISATNSTSDVTIMTKDDTYLDKAADFETTWDDIVTNQSDERVYTQLKKAHFNPDLTEFTALENELPAKEKDGFFELFKAAQGNLRHVYLAGFYHSNTPTDGQSEYYFRVPTSETAISYFKVDYDRLQQKIERIEKQ